MTVVLLVRHGMCDPVGRSLAGRTPGVSLNAAGQEQADVVATALAALPLAAIYSSPLERARETAEALARRTGLEISVSADLVELDYGAWTGRSLDSLAGDPVWREYNLRRGATRIPGGETMNEVVARAARALAEILAVHPAGLVAAVTHGDVIRALLASLVGMPLDHMLRLEVAPGSVTAVRLGPPPQLLTVNWVPALGVVL
jgi:probable phosphomutase (TIGR03848 family)